MTATAAPSCERESWATRIGHTHTKQVGHTAASSGMSSTLVAQVARSPFHTRTQCIQPMLTNDVCPLALGCAHATRFCFFSFRATSLIYFSKLPPDTAAALETLDRCSESEGYLVRTSFASVRTASLVLPSSRSWSLRRVDCTRRGGAAGGICSRRRGRRQP